MIKNPIVFDSEIAKKIGVNESIVLQFIYQNDGDKLSDIKQDIWTYDQLHNIVKGLMEIDLVNMDKPGVYSINKKSVSILYKEEVNNTNELVNITSNYSKKFEEIWEFYNKDKTNRGSKKNAFDRWNKLPISKLPIPVIKEIISYYRDTVEDVKFTKHFSTFLSQKIYENYAPELCKIKDKNNVIWKGYLFPNYRFFAIDGNNVYAVYFSKPDIDNYRKEGKIWQL